MGTKSKVEPRLLKGMRDFLPSKMLAREWVIKTIKKIFEKYGFEPLETPAIEYLDILEGKAGEEEKLIYRFKDSGGRDVGLRFDLTVPLSRVIAMNPNMPMPFRRYQIQPAWRAEKPQKGRFREFYQCDVDIVGTASLFADAEIITITKEVLTKLGFEKFKIRINNRKILKAICGYAGVNPNKESSVCISIDKLEKVGIDGVEKELLERGIQKDSTQRLFELLKGFQQVSTLEDIINKLNSSLGSIKNGKEGVEELKDVFSYLDGFGISEDYVSFDPWLTRGLDYYTGPIFEAVVEEPKIGSLAGGGRYDKLIGMFLGRDIPATGITVGLERIITVMEEFDMLPKQATKVKVLIVQFNEETLGYSLDIANRLRTAGIEVEVYPEPVKLSKQFRYADRRKIKLVLVAGPDEIAEGKVTIKDMMSGEEKKIEKEQIVAECRAKL